MMTPLVSSSSLTDLEITRILYSTGHLEMPFGQSYGFFPTESDLEKMNLKTQEVRTALQSYQSFHAAALEPYILKAHPQRQSSLVIPDGDVGPATQMLFQTSRCACPDYAASRAEPAYGSGNWKGCHGIDQETGGQFHCCKVRIGTPPAFLAPVWDEIWERVVTSYEECGLRLIKAAAGENDYNTTVDFVNPTGGWIGLAIVGSGYWDCSRKMWARFDRNYRPQNLVSEWTTLLKHEFGHNVGMDHASSGVMSAYIRGGLPVSWKNDVCWPILAREFGGIEVPRKPGQPAAYELVVSRKYKTASGYRYEDVFPIPRSTDQNAFWPFPSRN